MSEFMVTRHRAEQHWRNEKAASRNVGDLALGDDRQTRLLDASQERVDTPELRALRIKQANLVGPAGYISMEDTEATELVQRGTIRDGDATSIIEMSRGNPDQQDTVITESLIRKFWVGYQKLMGY